MCGILGWFDPQLPRETDESAVARAMKRLETRGPDGSGIACGEGWLLGHTRLAILDLSERARQPMHDTKAGWLVYNGEIYNYREIRTELETQGHTFHSSGDTEVLLKALEAWGVRALDKLRGMFAFAWWNEAERELWLVRDRFGVKPLAYSLSAQGGLRFASEIQAVRALPGQSATLDTQSLYWYMGLGYVPAPHSIYQEIKKVMPGQALVFSVDPQGRVSAQSSHPYFKLAEGYHEKVASLESEKNPAERYRETLEEAIRYRLVSDVPVGTLLSGGVDSSLVTSVAHQHNNELTAYTMGFDDARFDESSHARAIAKKLACKHQVFTTSEQNVQSTLAGVWSAYDEPFADTSALPTWLLCQHIARETKVVLSGDGGDEAFNGYPWHRAFSKLAPYLRIPALLRSTLSQAFQSSTGLGHRLRALGQRDPVAVWSYLRSGFDATNLKHMPLGDGESPQDFDSFFRERSHELDSIHNPLIWACGMDILTYLPDDLLVKTDRASMSVGLEIREPMLDHELVLMGLALPESMRYDHAQGTGKHLLRKLLSQYIPREIFEKPKQGFVPPIDNWLKETQVCQSVGEALHSLEKDSTLPFALKADAWMEGKQALHDPFQQYIWRLFSFQRWYQFHHG